MTVMLCGDSAKTGYHSRKGVLMLLVDKIQVCFCSVAPGGPHAREQQAQNNVLKSQGMPFSRVTWLAGRARKR